MSTQQPLESQVGIQTKLRAYLACALTDLGDSERKRVYALCKQMKTLCAEHGVSLYLPFEHTDPLAHAEAPAAVVYEQDRKQVITSDFILVFCVLASYGVGQENEIAADHGVPVIYLVQMGCRVSRMLLGSDTRKTIIEYKTETDLMTQLRACLQDSVPALERRHDTVGIPEPLGMELAYEICAKEPRFR